MDNKAMFIGNTGYILTSDALSEAELGRLCELLNSAISLYQLDVICTKFDETGWRWLRQFVECINLPKSLDHWCKAFGFTNEEIAFISSRYNHVLLD